MADTKDNNTVDEGMTDAQEGPAPPGSIDTEFYDENADFENEAWVNRKFFGHRMTQEERQQENQRRKEKKEKAKELRALAAQAREVYKQQQLNQGESVASPLSDQHLITEDKDTGQIVPTTTATGSIPNSFGVDKNSEATTEKRKRKEEDKKKDLQFQQLMRKRRTDAVLSCPACFTPLCYDCQQHAYYHHQYRAMFVTEGCKVDRADTLHYPPVGQHPDSQEEYFYRVSCAECGTEVGVMEKTDEVYHFYNVMPGN